MRRNASSRAVAPVAATLLAVAVLAGSLAAGCTTFTAGRHAGEPSEFGGATPERLVWHSCRGSFECATLAAPLNYEKPNARTMHLALIRLPAGDRNHRVGSLLVNPGGPGGSGVEFVAADAEIVFPSDIRDRFDIVGFDPRGVGSSDPIRCGGEMPPSTFIALDTESEVTADIAANREMAGGCRSERFMLPYLGTEDVARDLEWIRLALGEGGLNYIGFSYGTLLGAIYADLFPRHIRTLVLDGAMDPSLDIVAVRRGQAKAFESELSAFLDACAAASDCAFKPDGDIHAAFGRIMEGAGTPQAWGAIVSVLYLDRTGWPYLANALEAASHGDESAVERLVSVDPSRNRDAFYINEAVSYRAVTCIDFAPPSSVVEYTSLMTELDSSAPHFGAMLGLADVACAYWPTRPTRRPAPVKAEGAPPIVVVGSTGDPATPYDWAVSVSKQISSSVLITRRGDGHTGYMFSGCIRDAVDAYLISRKVPQAGLTCDS